MTRCLLLSMLFIPRLFGFQSGDTLDAYAAGVQGTVVFQVLIDQRGRPSQISVLSPLGYGLNDAAAAALAQWRYQPVISSGKAVKALTLVTFNFPLTGVDFNQLKPQLVHKQ